MLFLCAVLLYEIVIISVFIFFPKIKRGEVYVLLIGMIILVFLCGVYTRPLFFRDTATYERVYNGISWQNMKGFNITAREPWTSMEYGFVLCMLIFKETGLPFRAFSVFLSLFSYVAIYFFSLTALKELKYNDKISINQNEIGTFLGFFALYLPIFGIFYGFVAIRALLSYAFIAIASFFALKKKRIFALLGLIVAFSVQRVSILGGMTIFLILFWKREMKKKSFLVVWIIVGVILFFEYRTHHLMIWLIGSLEDIWNSIMKTGIGRGFLEDSDHGLRRLLLFFAYWLNGIIYYLEYRKSSLFSAFSLIFLSSFVVGAVICGYSASYRFMDYFYMYTLPVNYLAITSKKNVGIKRLLILVILCMFALSWGKSFSLWYYE